MNPLSLDDAVLSEIRAYCARGDKLVESKQYEEAFLCYRSALNLVPSPVEDWETTTWILAAIGDLYFSAGRIEKSLTAFEDAVRCPGSLGNPFIHLRIGQCHLELGHEEVASDELMRAFMTGGNEAFKDQDPKYLRHIQKHIEPQSGKNTPAGQP